MRNPKAEKLRLAFIHCFCDANGNIHHDGALVLADLKRFCRINRGGIVVSPVSKTVDPYATIYSSGLRDAYLRIIGFINLGEDEDIEEIEDVPKTSASEP